ncbi:MULTISPECIES: general stress protein [unclassified Actinotalea]|uniref:general stress protein n=1 Tax=unclassified Actinotalea TaxID=2638618 RepID=UPI0015F6B42F|nr:MULTISPECIES: general stress protein [unclassified Actinotalea]
MTMNGTSRVPGVPTLPKGEQVARYPTYLEAQRAVDHLSDKEFPVQNVTIVGTDLQMVERVTGRLTYPRVALAGLASGAWFGLFVGLLLSFFASPEGAVLPLFPAIAIGAAFGILFSVISYALTGGKRDFTSSSQIVASSYSLLCAGEQAHRARALLGEIGATVAGGVPGVPQQAPVTAPPQAPYPQAVPPQTQVPPQAAPQDPYPPQQPAPGQAPYPPQQPPAGPQS